MNVDPILYAAVEKAIAAKPRHAVSAPILCAVVLQESGGVPYFIDMKPGSIFKMNINGAQSYMWTKHVDGKAVKERRYTGLKERQIRDLITIPPWVGKYQPAKVMVGQLAKFRFEPGYWERYHHLPMPDRFYYSCSWGLCQFMGPNISKKPDQEGIDFIKRFMADTGLQLLYGAGMVDELLFENEGDIERMYRAYNSGDPNCASPSVRDRAHAVHKRATEIAQLKGGKHV